MDKNPRSIYEGVQAGLPVFVSAEAQVSNALTMYMTICAPAPPRLGMLT